MKVSNCKEVSNMNVISYMKVINFMKIIQFMPLVTSMLNPGGSNTKWSLQQRKKIADDVLCRQSLKKEIHWK